MLKHAITLGMFIASGLLFAIGSIAPLTLLGFAMLGFAIGIELNAWHRVMRARRSRTAPASGPDT